ncbi:MAG TPA: rhodanese-like domain-containing protein [Brumimicrobium sp.]|nr:rhodanese-like domain-containing protein [Brumimicrobium sp.]
MSFLKTIGLNAIMFGTVIFSSCSNSQTSEASKTEISTQKQNEGEINFDKAFIVDVRTPQEFASGHYEGAVNIPLNQVSQQLSEFDDKEQIVVYCRSGARSGNAKQILESNGYTNVINAINLSHLNKLKKEQE